MSQKESEKKTIGVFKSVDNAENPTAEKHNITLQLYTEDVPGNNTIYDLIFKEFDKEKNE